MATQSNIMNDLSSITKVPKKVLDELVRKENLCIGSAIHDALLNNEDILVVNIGIGTLSVELKTRQSKFIPSKELKSVIKKSIEEKIDPLEFELNQDIAEKLLHISDEVL